MTMTMTPKMMTDLTFLPDDMKNYIKEFIPKPVHYLTPSLTLLFNQCKTFTFL